MQYLSSLEESSQWSGVKDRFSKMKSLYGKHLWHQLSLEVESFLSLKEVQGHGLLPSFFEEFISQFKREVSSKRLAHMCLIVSRDYGEGSVARNFLSVNAGILESDPNGGREAFILLKCEEALRLIQDGELSEARNLLEEAKALLEAAGLGLVENETNANFYFSQSAYHKGMESFDDFYHSGLLFLAYVSFDSLPPDVKQTLAYDLALAALLAKKLHNFGELLMHPLCSSLPPWLSKLLLAFNQGEVSEYLEVIEQYHGEMQSNAKLLGAADFLKEKFQLMSLVQLAFNSIGALDSSPNDNDNDNDNDKRNDNDNDTSEEVNSGDKSITFEEITAKTKVPLERVEMLVLRAMALKLLGGVIDQVASRVLIHWVVPRVLDKKSIGFVEQRVKQWSDTVKETLRFVEKSQLVAAC